MLSVMAISGGDFFPPTLGGPDPWPIGRIAPDFPPTLGGPDPIPTPRNAPSGWRPLPPTLGGPDPVTSGPSIGIGYTPPSAPAVNVVSAPPGALDSSPYQLPTVTTLGTAAPEYRLLGVAIAVVVIVLLVVVYRRRKG